MSNPPITIGELTDVPSFGSPITSPWAQDVSRRVEHRFDTVADRDTDWSQPENGSIAYITGTQQLTIFDGAVWVTLYEPPRLATGNTWPGGTTIWETGDAATTVTSPTGSYRRSAGQCWFEASFVPAAGLAAPFTPGVTLPFPSANSLDGTLQVAILQAGRGWFEGWAAASGPSTVAIYVLTTDGAAGGHNCIIFQPIDATTPFNWAATPGSQILISGWYRLATPS